MRANAPWVVLAGLATAALGWLGLYGFAWNDYENEALPAIEALVHGHLGGFFSAAPAYGGSLLERAPFALAPSLWGGGSLAVYRMLALPCLLAGGALGLWLQARVRSQGGSAPMQAVVLGLCVANPLTLTALEIGHPEELLGGSLCVAAVLLAVGGQAGWAGVLLGAAFANKQWAIVALGPVLLALPDRRALCVSCAVAVSAALLVPFLALGSGGPGRGTHLAAISGSTIFQPWQLWWFIGSHGHVVHGLFGAKPGYRTGPTWLGSVSHPLIVVVACVLSVAAWTRRRSSPSRDWDRASRERSALLLLALLFALRCMLDTWDNVYYPLPFVLALTAWEALALERAPVLALATVIAVWAEWQWLPSFASADAQAAFFSAWSVPLAIGLALMLYAPGKARALAAFGGVFRRPHGHSIGPLSVVDCGRRAAFARDSATPLRRQ